MYGAVDPVAQARAAGDAGITAKGLAVVMFEKPKPTTAEVAKARRRLDALVSAGELERIDGDAGTQQPTRWVSAGRVRGWTSPTSRTSGISSRRWRLCPPRPPVPRCETSPVSHRDLFVARRTLTHTCTRGIRTESLTTLTRPIRRDAKAQVSGLYGYLYGLYGPSPLRLPPPRRGGSVGVVRSRRDG